MKVKKYLSVWAMVCAGALTLAGCSDYDNGYNENAIKFQEEFRKAYGDIDPEQDWNLAERASVTVNTQKESNIKIYALHGNEFAIVGDYQGVNGTRMLGIDLVEDTRVLYVTDGRTAQKCAPGDVVTFSGLNTRTTYGGNGTVRIEKLTGPITIGDVTYPMYKYATTEEELKALTEDVIPEGEVNLTKVTHDFTYVSNGDFIIYPYYWVTSSRNTIGLYYYDANGQRVEVDIYTAKEANDGELGELQYEAAYEGSNNPTSYDDNVSDWSKSSSSGNFQLNTWSNEDGLANPYMEYWTWRSNPLDNATINHKTITVPEPGNYIVEIDARIMREGNKDIDPSGVSFIANNKTYDLSQLPKNVHNNESAYRSGTIYLDVVTVNSDRQLNVGFEVNNANVNWLAFKNLKVTKMGTWKTAVDQGKNQVRRSQGIHVHIDAGTKFGMYLKKGDQNNPSYQFYSEDELNDVSKTGSGIEYNGSGDISKKTNWHTVEGLQPCHASTFYIGDQMFIGFEDWPNDANQSDFDLNDLVLAFDGATPTIINEDPEVTSTWLLVCEDLGGSFDTDYNDVIFKVEHVSGQAQAKVTPMAAGGTLASYIVFNDPTTGGTTKDYVVGEIHQLFGVANQPSGAYEVINATSRWEKSGATVEIPVHENWTIAYNVDDLDINYNDLKNLTAGNGDKGDSNGVNMGGFCIVTLKSGEEVSNSPTVSDLLSKGNNKSVIAAPDKGEAPYILCLPYTYTKDKDGKRYTYVWAWPQELCTICESGTVYNNNGKYSQRGEGGAYPDFAIWVIDYTSKKDWYKNENGNGAIVEKWQLSVQDINDNNKLDSQLGNNGSIEVMAGDGDHRAAIIANLTGRSSNDNGNIIIRFNTPTADPWTNGNTLWQVGERTVYVTEAATENTKEGTTSFKLTVKPAANAKVDGLAFTLQIGDQQETDLLKTDQDVTAKMGDYFWIFSKSPNNRWEEYHRDGLTAAYNNNQTTTSVTIGTNKYNWNNAIGFEVTRWGYQTVTLTAPENDLYNAQSITINVNVTGKVIMKSTAAGGSWGMAIRNGELRTVKYDENDDTQKWYVEGTVAKGKLQKNERLNLRNVATNQYLSFDDSHDLSLEDSKPDGSQAAGFTFESDGSIKWVRSTVYYLGLNQPEDDYLNKNWGNWPTGLVDSRKVYKEDGNTVNRISKFEMVVVP